MKISEDAKIILIKHQDELKNSVFLPLFIDALIKGGLTLFDELRKIMEESDICIEDADFSKLK